MEDLTVDDKSDVGAASTSGDDEENAGRQSTYTREGPSERMPLRESQMTVPETPSPDMLAAGKGAAGRRRAFLAPRNIDHVSPPKARTRRKAAGAVGTDDQVKGSHHQICSVAEKIFNKIRQGVTCHAAPSSLKAAFLEPLSGKLASHMAIDLLACTDDEFMAMFTGESTLQRVQPLIMLFCLVCCMFPDAVHLQSVLCCCSCWGCGCA